MANPSRIVGDQYYVNDVTFGGDVNFPDGVVDDADIANAANIDADKLEHIHAKTYSQPNTTATTETRVIHAVAGATGSIVSVSAGLIAANAGAATVTVDLKKSTGGGAFATVLSGVISLGSGDAAITPKAGTVSSSPLVVGDVLEIVITATAGGGTLGTGLFVHLRLKEDAQ